MALTNVTFKDVQKYMGPAGNHPAGPKSFGVAASSPWSNQGASTLSSEMTIIDTAKKMETLVRPIFAEYKQRHPFRPTKAALTNPGLLMLEKNKWMKRATDYIKNNEKKIDPQFQWKQYWDLKEDKKPRHNAKPSSSWLKHIKVNGNTVSIDLGGKFYDYRITSPKQLEQFLHQQSMGHIVSKLRTMPSGSYGGLTLIPNLRRTK